ncbi:helix-turn-helix domain-containing protein [Pelagibacterium xiamenense]|uniref:helix-turn-helix domain-containing protein n=1 Tax=Pelagibacterium xiamenense TaxID=2901140 RepID=UPI001E64B400|nr:helix-turn-helix domain-containing protein [Pelagibacterium xiamenense]MCD7060676.1 helix-turn-helix domain-containing protein [Pelagibacterium xiamenense]
MNTIPTYALYGESETGSESWLHWETITSRSQLYGFHIAPHRHEQLFQVLYLASGVAEVAIDEESRTLTGASLVTVPPLIVHSYRFSPDVEGVVLTLFARDVRAVLADVSEMVEDVMRPRIVANLAARGVEGEIDHAVRRLVVEADREAPGQIAALKARLMLLLLAIWRLDSAGLGGKGDRAEMLARDYQALVDAHFRESRAVPFYAGKLGITPTHLNRVCRRVFGASALAVIERRVVLEAKRYLQFSALSIKEIGILLGYSDPAYFSRFFARRAGTAPTTFRGRVKPADDDRAREGAQPPRSP